MRSTGYGILDLPVMDAFVKLRHGYAVFVDVNTNQGLVLNSSKSQDTVYLSRMIWRIDSKPMDDSGPGIIRPLFEESIKFELWAQYIEELKENVLFGKEDEDPHEHVARIMEIIDLFHSPGVSKDQDVETRRKLDFRGPIPRMTPSKGIEAIKELSRHSFLWDNEYSTKDNTGARVDKLNNNEDSDNAQDKHKDDGAYGKNEVKESEVQRNVVESYIPPILFPGRLKKEKEKEQFMKFFQNLQQLSINIPFVEMFGYTSKRDTNKALADLGASISLMSYSMLVRLELGENYQPSKDINLWEDENEIRMDEEKLQHSLDMSTKPCLFLELDDLEPDSFKNPTLFPESTTDEEKQIPKLKELTFYLKYAFLDGNQEFPVIISSLLSHKEKDLLLQVLSKHKDALAWKVAYIKDDFSGYFQIPLAPEDQEKITFTCLRGTFTYRRMPFGLCNAPTTFQRCTTTIFHDMCKDFMDDFSVFVLRHKISGAGIEVDKAKVDVISKLPYPTNVKGIRSFLGHAGFYRRFFKYFSKFDHPMTQLLMNDTKFVYSDDCIQAFNVFKKKLTITPIIIAPD
ncbi:hypothetical protein Tco_1043176 [Tanacetum coccineum]|uniref:Reverse transcriptase domain-containing protein n=1 Tax=Tanacetum coccineum TaxID=301880 RepID=A0ABQ5GMK2_9ASTR